MKLKIKGQEHLFLFENEFRDTIYKLLEECPHFYKYKPKDSMYKVVRGSVYLFFLILNDFEKVSALFNVSYDEVYDFSGYAEGTDDDEEKRIAKEVINFLYNNIDIHIV